MIKSALFFIAILIAALVAGGAWGAHEAFMHHWPAVHAKFPGLSDWWNPAESWRYKYRDGIVEHGRNLVPIWFTDAKHLLFCIHGLSVALAFYLAGREIEIVGSLKKMWPWGYALYLGGIALCYTVGNYVFYNIILG